MTKAIDSSIPQEFAGVFGPVIDGAVVSDTSAGTHPHIYPATGTANADVAFAGPEEVDRAVRSSATAQKEWIALPEDTRRDLMLRLADLVAAQAEQLALLSIADNGVPRFVSQVHPMQLERWLRYYAGWIDKVRGESVPVSMSTDINLIEHEPYGVIGIILPWNGPLFGIAMGAVPALAAGNAVILKPSELAPLATIRFADLCRQAGLPDGLVNVIPGDHVAGAALVEHPGVGKIHFTGSGEVARRIQIAAAGNLTPVATELGGKSANIIFDDASLDEALAITGFVGPLAQSGQSCSCGSRVFVQDSIYDAFVEKLATSVSQAPVGDPTDPSTIVAPVISQNAMDRILGVISQAQESGAGRLVTGGQRVSSDRLHGPFGNGYYLEPTIFADLDNRSELARRETFGPVIGVTRFRTEDEVVALANDTNYGLVGYVQTSDLRRAHRVARRLETGTVFVNAFSDLVPTAPYGGWKQSGQGRLGGVEGLREFTQPRSIRIGMSAPQIPE